jgi:hypothetical protein
MDPFGSLPDGAIEYFFHARQLLRMKSVGQWPRRNNIVL